MDVEQFIWSGTRYLYLLYSMNMNMNMNFVDFCRSILSDKFE